MLVRKWTGTSAPDRHFVWDQGHLTLELNATAAQKVAEYAYLPGTDRPAALLTGSTMRTVHQDIQGNLIGLLFQNGSVFRYQLFGDPWGYGAGWNGGQAMPDTMRLQFQGLMGDGAPANLFYARARWYDPLTKRFMSPDPLGVFGGVNLYAFAGSDPLNRRDAFGLRECYEGETQHADSPTYIHGCQSAPIPDYLRSGFSPHPSDRGGRPWATAGPVGNSGSAMEQAFLGVGQRLAPVQPIMEAYAGLTFSILPIGMASLAPRVAVLGNYPSYLIVADRLGARAFSVPNVVWKAAPGFVRFLNRAVVGGLGRAGYRFKVVFNEPGVIWSEELVGSGLIMERGLLEAIGFQRVGSWIIPR